MPVPSGWESPDWQAWSGLESWFMPPTTDTWRLTSEARGWVPSAKPYLCPLHLHTAERPCLGRSVGAGPGVARPGVLQTLPHHLVYAHLLRAQQLPQYVEAPSPSLCNTKVLSHRTKGYLPDWRQPAMKVALIQGCWTLYTLAQMRVGTILIHLTLNRYLCVCICWGGSELTTRGLCNPEVGVGLSP